MKKLIIFCLFFGLLSLVACGVEDAPRHPEGSLYPQNYPAY